LRNNIEKYSQAPLKEALKGYQAARNSLLLNMMKAIVAIDKNAKIKKTFDVYDIEHTLSKDGANDSILEKVRDAREKIEQQMDSFAIKCTQIAKDHTRFVCSAILHTIGVQRHDGKDKNVEEYIELFKKTKTKWVQSLVRADHVKERRDSLLSVFERDTVVVPVSYMTAEGARSDSDIADTLLEQNSIHILEDTAARDGPSEKSKKSEWDSFVSQSKLFSRDIHILAVKANIKNSNWWSQFANTTFKLRKHIQLKEYEYESAHIYQNMIPILKKQIYMNDQRFVLWNGVVPMPSEITEVNQLHLYRYIFLKLMFVVAVMENTTKFLDVNHDVSNLLNIPIKGQALKPMLQAYANQVKSATLKPSVRSSSAVEQEFTELEMVAAEYQVEGDAEMDIVQKDEDDDLEY